MKLNEVIKTTPEHAMKTLGRHVGEAFAWLYRFCKESGYEVLPVEANRRTFGMTANSIEVMLEFVDRLEEDEMQILEKQIKHRLQARIGDSVTNRSIQLLNNLSATYFSEAPFNSCVGTHVMGTNQSNTEALFDGIREGLGNTLKESHDEDDRDNTSFPDAVVKFIEDLVQWGREEELFEEAWTKSDWSAVSIEVDTDVPAGDRDELELTQQVIEMQIKKMLAALPQKISERLRPMVKSGTSMRIPAADKPYRFVFLIQMGSFNISEQHYFASKRITV